MLVSIGLGWYRTAWMLCVKLHRAMVIPERKPLSGVVETDDTIMPFRAALIRDRGPLFIPSRPYF